MKEHKETLGGFEYIYYFDYGDGVMGVNIGQSIFNFTV